MKESPTWDLVAAGLSSACLVHCLLMPFAVALIPAAGIFSDNHAVHLVLVMLAVPVTLWVVWSAVSRGGAPRLFVGSALLGAVLLIAAVAVSSLRPYETELTVIGSLLVASAHLWRWTRVTQASRMLD